MKFLEVHVVQNLPPSALNRDDSGRPKTVVYGGVERLRISSQAQKRATRLLTAELELVPPEERAVRTRKVEALLEGHLGGLPEEERKELVKALFGALGLGVKEGKGLVSEYLLFLSAEEAKRLGEVALAHKEALLSFWRNRGEEGERRKGKAKREELPKEAREALESVFAPGLEVALYGRMVADLKERDVEGALAVAHAIGTTDDPVEEDYFVAVDDLAGAEEASVGMIEARGFAAGTVYRYAVLDLGELASSVGRERALLGAKAVAVAFPLALPHGGKRAFAHFGEPEVVVVRVGEGMPRNLAKAFARPVEPRGEDPALASAKRLLAYHERLSEVYGGAKGERLGILSLFPELSPTFPHLEAMAQEVVAWAGELL